MRRHSSRMAGPPARWMAPSTPPPPSRPELAALTIASVVSRVMSPRTSSSACAEVRAAVRHRGVREPMRPGEAEGARKDSGPLRPRAAAYFAPRTASLAALATTNFRRCRAGILIGLAGLGVAAHARLVAAHDQLPDAGDREAVLGLLVGHARPGPRGRPPTSSSGCSHLLGQGGHDLRLGHRLCAIESILRDRVAAGALEESLLEKRRHSTCACPSAAVNCFSGARRSRSAQGR